MSKIKPSKILIIGAPPNVLMLQDIKQKYGDNIVLVTPDEAKQQGLKPEDFDNLPSMKITPPPLIEHSATLLSPLSGKEQRRQRRMQERKATKKRK